MKKARHAPEASPSGEINEREVAALIDASKAAGEPIDLSSALHAILDAARNLLGADEGSIQLLDPASQTLWIAASRGIPQEVVRGTRVPLGHGISGRVASSGRGVLLTSPADVERYAGLQAKERRIASSVCVPMRARGGIIGVLSLDIMKSDRTLGDRDLKLAVLFADNAAHAIMGRQLMDRSERQSADLETLREATTALGSTLDLSTLADEILTKALSLAGAEAGLLCLAGPGGEPVTLARYRGFSRELVKSTLSAPGFASALIDPLPGFIADDDGPFGPLRGEAGAGNALVLLRALPEAEANSSDATGVLVVSVSSPYEPKMRLLRAFSDDAGLALGNSILHKNILDREEELETIVASVPSPIVLVDRDVRFRALNPAAAELFRLSPEFELGEPIDGKLGDDLEDLLFSQQEAIGKEVFITVGGMQRAYRASVTAVRIGQDIGGRVLVLYDVTAERELEARKADFLAVIGHELRTPLTAIRGFTSTVMRNDDHIDPTLRKESLQRVLVQAERLERLIEDLLFVSRIEQHRPPVHYAWDDAVAVATAVVDEFRRGAPERTILLDAWSAEMPVRMDRVKVEQILYHLLDNALKYSEADTEVRVSLTQTQNDIEIAIADRGIGIYSGDIPRLFRAFGQLDFSSTRQQGGTGVGLHVAKTLCDIFGGRIWVDSVLGKGSTFTFSIPRVPPAGEDWPG